MILAFLGASWLLYGLWTDRAILRAPGQLAPDAPQQESVAPESHQLDGYDLNFRARFDIRARVLAHKNYRTAPDGDLVPYDLALGWGAMSDSAVLDHIAIHQGTRTYGWYVDDFNALPNADRASIETSSANMHIIPANESVREKLSQVRTGDIVHITGFLTDFKGHGVERITSTTRDDVGAGSCEIIYAESFSVEPRP